LYSTGTIVFRCAEVWTKGLSQLQRFPNFILNVKDNFIHIFIQRETSGGNHQTNGRIPAAYQRTQDQYVELPGWCENIIFHCVMFPRLLCGRWRWAEIFLGTNSWTLLCHFSNVFLIHILSN